MSDNLVMVPPPPRRTARSYGGVPAEVRVAQRRERFLDAGLELFGTDGFRSTGVRAVCRQAGLSERYFYESFASTEALLVGVYQRCTDAMHDRIMAAMATSAAGDTGDPVRPDPGQPDLVSLDRLVRLTLEAFFDSVDDPRVLRVCWLEVLGVSPTVDATYIGGIDRFAALLAAVMAGTFDLPTDEQLRLVATALVGGVITTAIRWYLDGQQEPSETLVDANALLFMGVARQLASSSPSSSTTPPSTTRPSTTT